MDFQDRNDSNDTSDVTASDAAPAASSGRMMRTVVLQPDANNVVTLPQGVSLDTIVADGRDLVIQADGVIYVIPDGAIVVPQLVVGGVTVPALNLAALLIGNEPVPAAGPQLNSSGGNFELTPGDIQAAYGLGDLLPYTELAFPQSPDEEIIPQPVDRPPTVIVITPDNPAGAVDAIAQVDEAGLPARGSEPAGTEQETNSETTTGTISYTAPDGTGSVLINGVEITAVGQTFTSPDGTLTITSIAEGAIGFSYTLNDNLLGVTEDGFFTVTVIDTDGDTASASLLIEVLDDAPIARNDTDAVAAGTYGPESGNVISAAGTTSGPAGADNVGADGATLTGIANSAGLSAAVAGPVLIAGAYGTLTIAPDGSYTYVRAEGTPGGVSDTFTYTLTDGDGSTATAVLTINIGDSPATVISVPAIGDPGTIVDEAGLPPRTDEAPGTAAPTPVEITSGTITFTAPDGPATVTINDVIITGPGQTITVPEGTLTIVTYDPETGTIDYTFTLGDNTQGDETSVTFDVTVTDVDDDSDSGSFTITILDDVPLAVDDSAAQIGENTPVTVDVFANDIEGADSVQLDAISAVEGTLSGTGAVVYNGDGTFTYTPGPGEEGTVTFDYSITDGDGDVSTATVTITLNDDSTPTLSVSGDNSVDEAGLPARDGEPAGSDSASDSEIASGVLNITTGGDTVGSLVINGVDVTNGGTVTTAKGALVITLDAGQYSYSYTLADNTLADPDSDSFSLTVTDSDGDQAATTLVIAIADDVPTASDDNAGQIAENQSITIDALANDVFGADDVDTSDIADVFVATQPAQGVVTYDPATGLFTYTPNAGAGSTSTVDSFTYTIVDGDGDSSTATVNVTLQPDSVPAVVDVTALADDDALAGGNPASTAQDIDANAGDDPLTASEAVFSGKITVDFGNDTGTVSFANLDGTSGTVGTETVDYAWDADSNTLTATGPRGVLFTVAMDADGNYVLTQLDNILHTAGNDEASADDVVLAYRASDSDGDTDETGTLTISFNDDAPTATADTNSLAEGGTVNGNVLTDGSDDAFGADGAVTTSPAGGVIGFAAGSDTSVAAGGTPGSTIESALGFLTLNADGSYSYASKPNSTNADTTDTFVYTIQDADGDISTQTLTISIDNVAGQVSDNDVLVDEAGLDTNGSQGAADSEIDADGQITVTGASGTLTYTLLDPADGTFGTLVLDSATGAYTYTLDTPVTDTTGDDGRNTVSGAVNGAEEFDYQVTDSVGNVIGTGTIVINIKDDVPSVVADDLFGGSLTVDESNLLVDDTGADFTGAFTVTMGADAPGSIAYALTLSAEGADSGLNDTATGADILLYTNGNTVEGRVGGADGAIAFVITNADGVLSLDQRSAVEHPDASNPNDVVDIDDGKIFLTATATDEDNDTASDSLDIGAALNFADDGPSVAITGPTPTLTVDETVLANNAVASFAATFTALFGADGAAAGTQPVYTLGVIAGPSGLVDTASGENVVLSLNGTVVEGRTAIGDALVFTVTVAADGTVTLDQIRAVVHTPDTGPDQATSLSAANLVTLTATATDFDGDTASAVLNIGTSLVFEDDAPSIDVTKGADAGIVLTTQDADTIGGASDTATSTADFGGVFGLTSNAGADGAAAPSLGYALSVTNAVSGLTSNGAAINLYLIGGKVVGSTAANQADVTAGNTVFDLSVSAAGAVTLTQYSQIDHAAEGTTTSPFDDQFAVLADGKVALTASATITDGDGDSDSDSETVDLGGNIRFADDGPSVATTGTAPTLTVDETVLATNASASFAANFTALFGADGAAAGTQPVYTLGVIAGPSGLVDTATGENVVLSLNGTVVEGRTAIGDALVFTVTVAADGTVTLDQIRAVVHTPDSGPDQATSLSAANLVTLTATATDFDGDTASAVLNIGTSLVFKDDAPSIDVTKGADAGIVLTTQDADTIGGASDTATSTADFGGVFGLTSNAGADGAAAPSLGYALSVTNAVSGLTSNGAAINLYLIGGKVVGSTAATQAGVTAGNTVFDLSVSAAGAVTLTQYSQIDHAAEGTTTSPFDDQFAVLADGKVALTASATITDGDGDSDSDSETVDLGGNIRFADDGPSVAPTGTAPTLTVDETVLATNASASFAANFTALFGADGAAAGTQPVYTLGVIAGPSGLVDTATGQNVVLSLNGTVVEGRTETGNVLVFTVAVAADGTVTLDQIRAVVHTPDSGPDQATSLSAANLVTLTATATDFDGDTASAVLNIGTSLVFKDDAPVVFNPEDGSVANTDSPPAAFDLNYGTAVGADGLGDVVFSITNGDPAVDSNGNALSFQGSPLFISGNGTNVLTASTAGGVVGFTITIDPDTDQYVVDLAGTISNGGEFSISNLTSAAAGNTEFRVVGSDNPTNNSDNIDIILSGRSSDGTRGTVNTNATSVGIDNQSTNPGEAVRIDFVNNATSGGLGTTGFDYDGHQDVLRFEQVIAQTGGNANTRVEINVTAILADDDQDFSFNGTTPEAGEFFIDITEVQVTDQNGGPGGSQIVHTFSLSDGPIQTKGAITVTFDANGSVNIDGLQVNDLYQVSSDEVFSAILVESPLGNNNFDLGIFDITTQNSADPIDVAFDIVGTDADGDSVTVPDGIQVTFAPVVAPIVLDLDRDGAEFLDLSAGVVYDYGSGAVATAWVGADDGLLARQTATGHDIVFADDAAGAKTDLEGLALAYDSNGDSKLDANDAAFAEFGVWQDADSDGVVDAGEFRSLTDAGITSINLTSDGIAYSAANGDVLVHGTGSYTKADGTTGVLADAGFATAAIAEMNQRGAQVASVNAAIAALVMPEMLMATDQETSGLSSKVLDLGTENPVSGSAQSTMAMADQMAVAGDDFFQSGNDAQASVSSPSIGQTGFENVSQGELGEPAAFDHAGLDLAASAGPAFSFGAVAGAAAFAAPSVEGVHMMDALLALGQDSAAKAQAVATESAEIAALDLSALQEAFADVVDSHAVDAIVDHFAGAALGEAQPESHFDAAILDVGIANPQMFFGMQSMVDMTADDMSALAASA